MTPIEFLKSLNACAESIEFASQFPDLQSAWNACRRPDWMFWLLEKIGYRDGKALHLFVCHCVKEIPLADGRTVWDLLTDERSRNAVIVAERFAAGEATREELDAAARDASAAARDAAWAATWAAAEAAAEAAAWAAWAATWDARAAWDAWDAAWAAAGATRDAARDKQCHILHDVVPWEDVESLIIEKGGE